MAKAAKKASSESAKGECSEAKFIAYNIRRFGWPGQVVFQAQKAFLCRY